MSKLKITETETEEFKSMFQLSVKFQREVNINENEDINFNDVLNE